MFANETDKLAVAAGDYLFREGDAPDLMYVLVSGQARILVGAREVEVISPGQFVGEMALIESGPRTASVQARTDCEFARINEKRFRFMVTETPGFALSVMRTMAERLRGADRMIEAADSPRSN
ncbi:MAG: cyclic nucleotide-binding domain-containing protein [Rhodocyclaceae bacterium]|jgi:CRP-like cAMP-binding protein